MEISEDSANQTRIVRNIKIVDNVFIKLPAADLFGYCEEPQRNAFPASGGAIECVP